MEYHISNITKRANTARGFLRPLIRSKIENRGQGDIDTLEREQRSKTRFIIQGYTSTQDGCLADMLDQINPTLQERRRHQRLTFLYKPMCDLLKPKRSVLAVGSDSQSKNKSNTKLQTSTKKYSDFLPELHKPHPQHNPCAKSWPD
ncbi:hypothetical protein DPMN_144446 [Dreissena polymorpha]|uniref:Uncharacterized protein n=1 Tax=Dreissena polymorpha TaxID=45954 RepID=A0A9D4GIX6_DREPO|nr:hypothetical protein DPMN_144446 [Dreissena polymorpha]